MDSYINKMVEDIKAQIADLETIDLIISELEDIQRDEAHGGTRGTA